MSDDGRQLEVWGVNGTDVVGVYQCFIGNGFGYSVVTLRVIPNGKRDMRGGKKEGGRREEGREGESQQMHCPDVDQEICRNRNAMKNVYVHNGIM